MELEKKRAFLIRAAYCAVWILLVAAACRYLWPLLLPFALGWMIAGLLRPVTGFIQRHSHMNMRMAAVTASLLFYGVLAVAAWLCAVLLYDQIMRLSHRLPLLYESSLGPFLQDMNRRMLAWITRLAPQLGTNVAGLFEGIEQMLQTAISTLSGWCLEMVGSLLQSLPGFVLGLLFTILSSILISGDYDRARDFIKRQIPRRWHKPLADMGRFLLGSMGKVTKAYLLLAAITFAELAVGFWILKIDSFLLAATVVAILDLLPVLGSGAVLIPWGVCALLAGNPLRGIGLLVLWVAIATVHQLLEPRIVGSQLGLHPLITLFAMYSGLKLAGFAGLVIAPILCLLARYLKENHLLKLYR